MESKPSPEMLPQFLKEPLQLGVLSLEEALALFDEMLKTPDGQLRQLPEHLWPAAQRLYLHEMEREDSQQLH